APRPPVRRALRRDHRQRGAAALACQDRARGARSSGGVVRVKSRPPRSPRSRIVDAGSFFASLAVHGLVVGAGAVLVSVLGGAPPPAPARRRSAGARGAPAPFLRPAPAGGPPTGGPPEAPEPAEPVAPGGGEPIARPDTARAGRGGRPQADSAAVNLADRD